MARPTRPTCRAQLQAEGGGCPAAPRLTACPSLLFATAATHFSFICSAQAHPVAIQQPQYPPQPSAKKTELQTTSNIGEKKTTTNHDPTFALISAQPCTQTSPPTSKYVQRKKMWRRFPYLGRKKGLFVIDVNEDIVPGCEAHVICNRSEHGHEQDTQLLRTPEPNHLQI